MKASHQPKYMSLITWSTSQYLILHQGFCRIINSEDKKSVKNNMKCFDAGICHHDTVSVIFIKVFSRHLIISHEQSQRSGDLMPFNTTNNENSVTLLNFELEHRSYSKSSHNAHILSGDKNDIEKGCVRCNKFLLCWIKWII